MDVLYLYRFYWYLCLVLKSPIQAVHLLGFRHDWKILALIYCYKVKLGSICAENNAKYRLISREILSKHDPLAPHVWYSPNFWAYRQKTGHITEATFIFKIKSAFPNFAKNRFYASKKKKELQSEIKAPHNPLTLRFMTKLFWALMFVFVVVVVVVGFFCYLYISEAVIVFFLRSPTLFLETKLPESNF